MSFSTPDISPARGPSMAKRLKPLERAPADGLLIHEIFASIQGESTYAGLPCTFVRTTGCNLRCTYCDTPHAFTQGEPRSLESIEAEVRKLGVPLVEVTGGEPLLQPNSAVLMQRLCDAGFKVLVETSGSVCVAHLDPRVVKILDLKTPSSGELHSNILANLDKLQPHDEVKFVLGHRADYDWAKSIVAEYRLTERCTVLMGPVFEQLVPRHLAEWILEDKLQVRMQLQLHKFIWDPDARGV